MICKWCGEALPSSNNTKCPRCGKELPPLSDCGGFYNLMPSAERYKETVPVQKTESRQTNSSAQKESQKQPSKRRKVDRGYIYITLLGFAAIIALIFVLFSKVNQYSDELKDIRAELNRVSEDLSDKENNTNATAGESSEEDFQTDPISSETTGVEDAEQTTIPSTSEGLGGLPAESTPTESVPAEPLDDETLTTLKNSALKFELYLADEEEGKHEVRRFNKANILSVICNYDKSTEKYICNFNSQHNQNQSEKAFEFKIVRKPNDDGYIISIEFEYEGNVLGDYTEKKPTTYKWQYHEPGSHEWKELPNDYCETSKPEPKFTQIDVDLESLLNKEHPGKTEIEICCTATRKNTSGGSLEIIIYGLTLSLDDSDSH